jgi:hypothetical protein
MMNPRVKELWDKAAFEHLGGDTEWNSMENFMEKFYDVTVDDILKVVAAHALSGDMAVDVFANLTRLYTKQSEMEE